MALGAPVAQWVKHWPTDLVDQDRSRSKQNLLNHKQSSIVHSLSLSFKHRPDMTENTVKKDV